MSLFPGSLSLTLAEPTPSYGGIPQALLAGAVAGVLAAPHCATMCGPLWSSLLPPTPQAHARYQYSRLLAYGLAGAIAGGVGGVAFLVPVFQQPRLLWMLGLALALGLRARGLWQGSNENLSGLVSLGHKPKPASKPPLHRRVFQWLLARRWVGAATLLLPCPASASALALAAGAHSAIRGLCCGLAFGLTSGVGIWFWNRFRRHLGRRPHRVASRGFAIVAASLALLLGLRAVDGLRAGLGASASGQAPRTAPGLCLGPAPTEPPAKQPATQHD